MNTNRLSKLCCALAAIALSSSGTQSRAAGPIAIQGAKIYTVSGEVIPSGIVLIRDGKIEAVGTDIKIPGEARVIDATGKVIIPGIVDAHSSAAMSQANERSEFVPFLSVVDSIDPVANYFEECRRSGVTSACVVPGNSTLIGGQSAILKTAGQYVNDMLVRREAGLKLSLRPTSGNRMSQLARLRKELNRAKQYIEREKNKDANKEETPPAATAADESGSKPAEPGTEAPAESTADAQAQVQAASDEASLKALAAAIQGEVPVYIYCENGMDVSTALGLVKEYGLKPIFVVGRECYKAAELLGKQAQTVILDPTLVYWRTNERTREDEKIVLPKLFRDAKVPFIFQTDDAGSRSSVGSSYFWYQAATGMKYGMSHAEALAALTLEPAKLLKIESMVGSIEAGKDADLVILTGEPFEITTWVEHTIVNGDIVYDRSKDEKLSRLLSPVAE